MKTRRKVPGAVMALPMANFRMLERMLLCE
jgi:hypothetical protein